MGKGKGRSPTVPVVITANRLDDGRPVWLGDGGRWCERLADARIYRGDAVDAGLAVAQESEKRQEVVGIYEIELAEKAGGFAPVRLKEQIRAHGPSIL